MSSSPAGSETSTADLPRAGDAHDARAGTAAARRMDLDGLRGMVQDQLDAVLAHHGSLLAAVGDDGGGLVEPIAQLVRGGKRLRAAFAYWGFLGAGGEPEDVGGDDALVSLPTSLELFQAAALIHDDLMDASDTRRGQPAVHRQFASLHRVHGWMGDDAHFGAAGAILAGDLCLTWSDAALAGGGLPPDALARVRPVFDEMRTQLMAGQYLDMLTQAMPFDLAGEEAFEAAIARSRRVICFKSAKYSVEHPLLMGAALADAPEALLASYSDYGLALGEAFQLRDDVLGVYGDPLATGKPAGDDLREGKRTVLVLLALQAADSAAAAALRAGIGDPVLDGAGVERLRTIIEETGALASVEHMIDDAVARSREALDHSEVTDEAATALGGLIDAATARTA